MNSRDCEKENVQEEREAENDSKNVTIRSPIKNYFYEEEKKSKSI